VYLHFVAVLEQSWVVHKTLDQVVGGIPGKKLHEPNFKAASAGMPGGGGGGEIDDGRPVVEAEFFTCETARSLGQGERTG
jgi:hypothetical protein